MNFLVYNTIKGSVIGDVGRSSMYSPQIIGRICDVFYYAWEADDMKLSEKRLSAYVSICLWAAAYENRDPFLVAVGMITNEEKRRLIGG